MPGWVRRLSKWLAEMSIKGIAAWVFGAAVTAAGLSDALWDWWYDPPAFVLSGLFRPVLSLTGLLLICAGFLWTKTNSSRKPSSPRKPVGGSTRPVETKEIDVAQYAEALVAHKREEWSIGQSEAIALGYESPVLELPPNIRDGPRMQTYIESLQRLPQMQGVNCEEIYARWHRDLPKRFRNDPNVMIDVPLDSLSESVKAYPCDFAIICGLERELGWRPLGVTGDVLAVTADGQTILLLNRGKKISRDAPDHLHVFGGATDPFYDLGSLAHCAEREFREESGRQCSVANCPVLLHREDSYKMSMITYLGVSVQNSDSYETEEGVVYALNLMNWDAVVNCFLNKEWVDSGRQAFLVWLGLGCPVQGQVSPSIAPEYARLLYEKSLNICRSKGLVRV